VPLSRHQHDSIAPLQAYSSLSARNTQDQLKLASAANEAVVLRAALTTRQAYAMRQASEVERTIALQLVFEPKQLELEGKQRKFERHRSLNSSDSSEETIGVSEKLN
jgi:hypothetical protein